MIVFHALAERVRRGESIPAPLAALLTSLTPFVRLGMAWRLRQPRVRVDARVISFGNITVGGTGKTPAVIERAREELAAGNRVAVLTRGYGTASQQNPFLVKGDSALAAQVGDEPALIARKAPGVVIAKGPDRVAAARAAIDRYGCDTLILDDGFQYVRLERDENVLLIDSCNPFGNGRLIPRGVLREPILHAGRATTVILTRCDQAGDLARLRAQVEALCPYAPIRETWHAPASLWRVSDGEEVPLEHLHGMRVRAACAIAHPEAFFRTLESLGAVLTERLACADHSRIPESALAGSAMLVTTEKDAMRMERAPENVYALGIELRTLGTRVVAG
jgi:tetraacyldisaccharide 4'-kinase